MGSLEDIDGVKRAAAAADGVIHLAFNHDFSKFVENCEDDRRVITALGSMLEGSDRPLVVTSGTLIVNTVPGKTATEEDEVASSAVIPRAASEEAARTLAAKGVNVSVMRLPQVHDTARQGLITFAIEIAREKGASCYVGDGRNRWSAVPVLDAARIYRLALEKAERGATYHAVAEEGVSLREIAETLGKRLNIPVRSIGTEEAGAHFGWLAHFIGRDAPASSELTRKRLQWQPKGRGLLADLGQLEFAAP
jgi:nucleoside-diphosphate-sugar epimerase